MNAAGQGYTARVIYEDTDANQVGLITIRASDVAGFTTVANHVIADTAIATSLGGSTGPRQCTGDLHGNAEVPRCKRGDLLPQLHRSQVTLTSFTDDAIRSRVETWADSVPALG